MLGVEIICPLGSKCEEIKDGKIYRCAWYTKLKGKDPQSEEQVEEWGCAIAWMPLMQVEVAQMSRGVNESVSSLRNEVVTRVDTFNSLAALSLAHNKKTSTI